MEEQNKMKQKNFITSVLAITFLLMSLAMVQGAITFTTPSATGATLNGTYVFNVTTALTGALNCTWATTEDGVFAKTVNTTADQTVFTNSTNTATLTDDEDTTLTVTCANASTTESGTKVINIDNTAPVCSFTVSDDVVEYMSQSGVQTTQASSDTTDLTYAWILYDPQGNSKTTSTSASPLFSLTDFDELGDFKIGLTVTDEASKKTACTNKTIMVNDDSDDDDDAITTGTTTTTSSGGDSTVIIIVVVVIIICIVAVGGWFLISSAKKGRR